MRGAAGIWGAEPHARDGNRQDGQEEHRPDEIGQRPAFDRVTVLDAVASLQRQPGDPGRMDLWVVRPNAGGTNRVLPVDWAAITQRGVTATNYQVLAGDRLFFQARLAK